MKLNDYQGNQKQFESIQRFDGEGRKEDIKCKEGGKDYTSIVEVKDLSTNHY